MQPKQQKQKTARRRKDNLRKYKKKVLNHPIWNRFIKSITNTLITLGKEHKTITPSDVELSARQAGIKVTVSKTETELDHYRINLQFGDNQQYNSLMFMQYLIVLEKVMRNYTNVTCFDTFFSIHRNTEQNTIPPKINGYVEMTLPLESTC